MGDSVGCVTRWMYRTDNVGCKESYRRADDESIDSASGGHRNARQCSRRLQ